MVEELSEQPNPTGLNLNRKNIIGIAVTVLLLVATALGVYLAQQKQLFKPKAFESKTVMQTVSGPETSFSLSNPGSVPVDGQVRISVFAKSDIDAANLFVAKLKFPTDLLNAVSIETGSPSSINGGGVSYPWFVKNWIEKVIDNEAGTISLVGGVPNPGFQTNVLYPGHMADIVFRTRKAGPVTISFDSESAIYRNSDNTNILSMKKDMWFKIELPQPTPGFTIAPSPLPDYSKRVFVTSSAYTGDLKTAGSKFGLGTATSGLDGADKICQGTAKAAGLEASTWKAWISDSTTSASERLVHSIFPYKLLNGKVVANNWLDLTDGTLQNPINVTESGATLNQGIFYSKVWTNTAMAGEIMERSTGNCNNWTSSSYQDGNGWSGIFLKTDTQWTNGGGDPCSVTNTNHLYCFEQTTPVAVTLTLTPKPVMQGDVNNDGKITLVDMSALLSKFGKSGAEAGFADLNNDGVVNSMDYSLMIQILIKNGIIKSVKDLPENLQVPLQR